MKDKKATFRGGNTPPLLFVKALNTVRLIPSRYSPNNASVLADVVHNAEYLQKIFDLDDATNDRLLAESDRFDGIGPHELVFGIPYASVINAAFTHYHLEGNRFSIYGRNAWYAAIGRRTSQAEVIFHKTIELHEMGVFEEEGTYDEYLSDFHCELHDLRVVGYDDKILAENSYMESQKLAENLFAKGSLGIVYPSVRDHSGVCIACFRPALVTNVRKGSTFLFRWVGRNKPVVVKNFNCG